MLSAVVRITIDTICGRVDGCGIDITRESIEGRLVQNSSCIVHLTQSTGLKEVSDNVDKYIAAIKW